MRVRGKILEDESMMEKDGSMIFRGRSMFRVCFLNFFRKSFHQSYLVVFLCGGIILGTITGVIFRINYFSSPLFLLAVGLGFLFGYLRPKYVFSIIMIVLGMILAWFRIAGELSGENYIRQFYGQTVILSGTVKGDPEVEVSGTKIKLGDLKFGEMGRGAAGNIYVTLRDGRDLARDDEVTVAGKMSEGFGTYAGYMYKPEVRAVRRAEPKNLVVAVRDWFAERVRGLIPEREASLGLSYLLGMKSGLPEDLEESIRAVGLTHIVVASGSHLSILVGVARRIFGRLSRFAGLLFAILFIMFFMVMVGFTPSIMRAGIMSILTILMWYVGRRFEAWRILLMVAAITLMINPMLLIDLGWLLSFASLFGILILLPRWKKFFYGENEAGAIGELILVTISATVMTLPITLYWFGAVSLIAVVANLLILPTLAVVMGLVFLTGVVAGVPVVAGVVATVATLALDFHIFVMEFFGGMKSFLVEMPVGEARVFLIYGLVLIPFIIGLIRRKMVKLRKVSY